MTRATDASRLGASSSLIGAGNSAFQLSCGFQRTLSGSGQLVTDSTGPMTVLHPTWIVTRGDAVDTEEEGPFEGLFVRLEGLSREGKLDAALDLVVIKAVLELGQRVLRYDASGAYLGSIPDPGTWRLAPSGDL